MTVSTTQWGATVSSANRFTTSTRRETSEILASVNVRGRGGDLFGSPFSLNSQVVTILFSGLRSSLILAPIQDAGRGTQLVIQPSLVYFCDIWRDEGNIGISADTHVVLPDASHPSQNVHVTQLVLRTGESVTATRTFLPVSLLGSVGVNYTWKENIVISAKKASMV